MSAWDRGKAAFGFASWRSRILGGILLLGVIQAGAWGEEKRTVKIIYQRSGGFIGMRQSLRIDGWKHLVAQDKNAILSERALTAEERHQLEGMLAALRAAGPPQQAVAKAGAISDAFKVSLKVEGGPRLEIETSTLSTAKAGMGEPWDGIFHWFDAKMTEEVRKAHPDAPQILSGEDLLQGN